MGGCYRFQRRLSQFVMRATITAVVIMGISPSAHRLIMLAIGAERLGHIDKRKPFFFLITDASLAYILINSLYWRLTAGKETIDCLS
jgi:hypothetical protein